MKKFEKFDNNKNVGLHIENSINDNSSKNLSNESKSDNDEFEMQIINNSEDIE